MKISLVSLHLQIIDIKRNIWKLQLTPCQTYKIFLHLIGQVQVPMQRLCWQFSLSSLQRIFSFLSHCPPVQSPLWRLSTDIGKEVQIEMPIFIEFKYLQLSVDLINNYQAYLALQIPAKNILRLSLINLMKLTMKVFLEICGQFGEENVESEIHGDMGGCYGPDCWAGQDAHPGDGAGFLSLTGGQRRLQ